MVHLLSSCFQTCTSPSRRVTNIYGCVGATAAALVPAKGNAAAPFFFLVFRDGASYKIYGEGLGDKVSTEAAMEDLKSLPGEALAELMLEAQAPKR